VGVRAFSIGMFAMGTAIKIDNGATVGISEAHFLLDGIGTVIDASSGGHWAGSANAPLSGSVGCNDTCFKMGSSSSLFLNGFHGSSQKSFVEIDDGFVDIANSQISNIGLKDDGADYYVVHSTGNSGGMNIHVRGSTLQGKTSSPHVHGIKTDVAVARLTVVDSSFTYFQDDLDIQAAASTIITNNTGVATLGPESIIHTRMGYGGSVVYRNNLWDKPPISVATACGAGCAVAGGAFSGYIAVGSTGPTTTGTLTLPWSPYGAGGGLCRFYVNGNATVIAAGTAGNGVWNWNSNGIDVKNTAMFFSCPGQE